MRTGAIFARGSSCKALAWLLALGAAAVLSAGEVAAQEPKLSSGSLTLDEGESDTVILTVDDGSAQAVVVTVQSLRGGTFDISWAGGNAAEFSGAASTATITVAANESVRLNVVANDDPNADDARVVLIFTIGSETTMLILRANDDDTSGVIVSERSLTLKEGDAGGDSYTIVLGTQPSSDVMVTAEVTTQINARIRVDDDLSDDDPADDSTLGTTSETLTFTSTNWDVAKIVTVRALSDANTRNGSATITNEAASADGDYSGVSGRSVSVTERDSVRTITLSKSADMVDEGEEIKITATLGNSDPDDDTAATLPTDVTVTLTRKGKTPPTSDYSIDGPNKITIGANSTAGSTTLEALHDADEDDETLTLIASVDDDGDSGIFTDIDGEEVTVKILDDDTYTLEADKTEVNEGDEVTLTVKVDPAAEVEETKVGIDLYRASGASVEPAEGQDADEDGNAIIDEGESTAKFTLKTVKDADSTDEVIEVQAMVGDAVVGSRVTINVVDGQVYTLSVEPDSIGEADGESSVMVTVDTNAVISSTEDTMLTLAVDAASTAMDPDDYSIMPAEMMVTISKGEKMGMTTLMVTPVADSMDESNETIVLTAWKDDAQVGNAATLTIIDGDSPGSGITAKSGTEVEMVFTEAGADGLMVGGKSVSVDMGMLFDVANADLEVMYIVSSSDETVLEVSATDSTLMLDPMMEGMSTVSVMAQPAGMASARGAVSAFTCVGACVSVNLDVAGAVTFMLTPAAVSVTEGGEGMTITATASQAVLANTAVMLMHGAGSASADDYDLVPVMITIMAGDTEGSTMLTATEDTDVEGMEAVTLNAMIGTMSVGMVEVTIEDNDMPTTYTLAPATGMVDEGGEAVITATASQAVMEDTMVSLTATGGTASADDYSVDAITIMTGETSGSTMLMANDDYDVEGMETLTLQGSIGAMIIGSVMFEIADNDMEITVELMGPEDMNLVEGGDGAMLTATASSAVPMDTTVMIMRDGTSSAGMDDFTADPITITAGETVGTTMVMAVEDNMPDSGAGMPEMLVLYGSVDGMNTNMVSFYIWDMAVPALPLIAQLLLAAFLAIGGYRRYLRR